MLTTTIWARTLLVLLGLPILLVAAGATQQAEAETLLWEFRSEHPKVVDVELYSQTRTGHVWPGNNKVYVLNDYSNKTIRISCRYGEKVCYGAWVRNRSNSYWGVGHNNRNGCKNCCYTCDSGRTKVIVLNP